MVKVKEKKRKSSDEVFTTSRTEIINIVGSKLDNAQYLSALLKDEFDRTKGKIGIGQLTTPDGRRYTVSISTPEAPALNSDGFPVATKEELAKIFTEGRENELNFDSLSYLEVEGRTPKGARFVGVFYSIADASKYVLEETLKGEL